jgi:hypothetical protein
VPKTLHLNGGTSFTSSQMGSSRHKPSCSSVKGADKFKDCDVEFCASQGSSFKDNVAHAIPNNGVNSTT